MRWDDYTGWVVAAWGFIVAHFPDASTILLWVSIVVGIFQIGYLYWRTKRVKIACERDCHCGEKK